MDLVLYSIVYRGDTQNEECKAVHTGLKGVKFWRRGKKLGRQPVPEFRYPGNV